MKLLRLASLHFTPIPSGWSGWEIRLGQVSLKTLGASQQEETLRLIVVAEVPLRSLPALTTDRQIRVPPTAQKNAEAAIEAIANFIAIDQRCRRSIASPWPCVAFHSESEDELAWLEATGGIRSQRRAMHGISYRVGLAENDELATVLLERLDGVALLAEAHAAGHATGKFLELVRLFERAFNLPFPRLAKPLLEFLKTGPGNYSKREIASWERMRNASSHASMKQFLLEADVRPIVSRVEQAAYDVLFNKADWRSPSPARQDVLRPPGGTASAVGDSLFLRRESVGSIEAQLIDDLGSYPYDLSANLTSLPVGWWSRFADSYALSAGQLRVE